MVMEVMEEELVEKDFPNLHEMLINQVVAQGAREGYFGPSK
jgi:hypothetical protein